MNLHARATQAEMASSVEALSRSVVVDIEAYSAGPGIFTNTAGTPVSIARAIADLQNYAAAKVGLADLSLPLPAKLSDIVTKLRRYGVVILPGLLKGKALQSMRDDFTAVIGNCAELAKSFTVTKDDSNVSVRLQREQMGEDLAPEIAAFYSAPLLATIAGHFYGHQNFVLNRQIFVHETRPTDKPLSGELHFDVSRMLKFWLYLEEGKADAGAIRMSPGTNLWLSKIREEFSDRLIPKAQIFNEVDEAAHPPLSIEAPEGSLVIFETDTAHGAGHVAPGKVRRIMRGHTMETKYIERAKQRAAA
jgi:ectoine hydroxylase-related dioxygenase (phytanoyl-CoA dioxygenase family)